MESKAHALLAGLFTLFLGAAAVFSLLWFNTDTQEFRELIVVSRQDVSGLASQARVSYRGIDVGKVLNVRLDPQDRHNILIRVQVDKSLPLGEDVRARLFFQGITGIAGVMLEDDEENNNLLPLTVDGELPRIPLRAGLITQLQDALPELLGEARTLLKQANALLNEENRRNVALMLARLESVSERADQALSAENVQALSGTVRHMPLLVDDARQMAQHIDGVATRLDSVLGQGDDWNEGLVPQLSRMSRELTATSRQLDRVLRTLERSPQSLIFGAPSARPGPGEAGFVPPEQP
ncbi:MAG: MlaD family protein [Zoogloeaceae bacterium]|jgi:phospholipid/cholesterol/gamma-HCH transport system substrate-binding protein|nr:MlaD family protein [Zoogloeaceae bacterium]